MFVSWKLLQDFLDVGTVTPAEAAERLTLSGAEIEAMTQTGSDINGVIVAQIAKLDVHPSDSHLFVASLDTGAGKTFTCVTSARNMKQGDKVFYAPVGSELPGGVRLTPREFAGIESDGMMLSAAEMGLPDVDDPSGLWILPEDAPIGTPATELYHIGDTILDVSITPNRGDLLSIRGMARELAGLFPERMKLKAPDWLAPLESNSDWTEDFGTISLPDKGCLAYRLGLATGVAIKPSPFTVQVDLAHLGMRPISNVVDVTNYVMLTLGQPLHAFDLNTLPAREITVRAAHDGETMVTLDDKERNLTEKDMLITSGGEAIALAGVMGGKQTGIADDTKTVVVESACFSPVRVGHTSRRLGIGSEAAFRFSRTVDPSLSAEALSAALTLIHDWSGEARVDYRLLSAENEHPTPQPIVLTKRKLGVYLDWDDMDAAQKILDGFGIHCIANTTITEQPKIGENLDVEPEMQAETRTFIPPSWRPDITIEEDLIEEVGRYRGYNEAENKLPSEMPHRAEKGNEMKLAGFVRNFMLARGYVEVMTYSFLPDDFPTMLHLNDYDPRSRPLKLANPISRDQIAMRTTLIPGLLSSLKTTLASGWRNEVRIFEQGRVFFKDDLQHIEENHMAGLVFVGADPRTPWKTQTDDFYSVKADIEALLLARGITPIFMPNKETFTHSGQTAVIRIAVTDPNANHAKVGTRRVGYIGRLKPLLEQELDIPGAVYVFMITLSELAQDPLPELHPVSAFPASLRDISMFVPTGRDQNTVLCDLYEAVAAASDIDILESLRLFDVYAGKGVPDGYSCSMAYSLSYRSRVRTLKDTEVEAVHSRVREFMTQKGYKLR